MEDKYRQLRMIVEKEMDAQVSWKETEFSKSENSFQPETGGDRSR